MSQSHHIKDFSVRPLRAPLNQPFRTALGTHHELENLLFILELEDGTKGYGEAGIAPHITGETITQTRRSLDKAGQSLLGRDVRDYLKISEMLHELLPKNKAAIAAVEGSLWDALTRQKGIPLWKFFGRRCRILVSDITIVIADLPETEERVRYYYRRGFRAFKVKIGKDEELDLKRVLAVGRLAPRSDIYLDANQGYSAQQTIKFVAELRRAGLRPALIEQPVARGDWEGLKRVSRLCGIPVCADESARSLVDVHRIIRQKAAQVINIKLMKTGLLESLKIARLARAHGVGLMIGGMLESSLAMTTAAHFASGLGGFDFVDLDTPFFIRRGFDHNPFLSANGVYDLTPCRTGVGIVKS